jgi:hypothetical protein
MIVIPMAGLSSRFTAAGYDRPKYMLPLFGRTLFEHSVRSFEPYFETDPFLFVFRNVAGTPAFVAEQVAMLGIRTAVLVSLDAPTAGQAETVEIGLRRGNIDPATAITIFNIDTFRPGFRFPPVTEDPQAEGYLEVFRGEGANWSFVKPSENDARWASETAEKRAISDLCCTGLYHFRRAADFLAAFEAAKSDETLLGPKSEIYVAPLYNWLIRQGRKVGYNVVDRSDVIFCGVPAEYDDQLAHGASGLLPPPA